MGEYIVGIIVGLMLGFMLFLLTLSSIMNLGYQQGQIDYANDKVLVHKVENEDNELVWKWIDEPKYD
jgi:divalent metal cation (Fe/Co/Zn/Cd) transporter